MDADSQSVVVKDAGGLWLAPVFAIIAWLPAMVAAMPVWRNGEYYDYGWFVPPAAAWLIFARWRDSVHPVRPIPVRWIVWCALILMPWVLVLRVLGQVDPSWRLPMWLLGGTAVLASHALIAGARGWRESSGFIWITLFWCSALPWPSTVESGIVHHLTRSVVEAVAELFHIFGKPVEVLGDRLQLHGLNVEVTDGCSGVRSFQSFLMATWFFAELQRLRSQRVMVLLLVACVTAFLVNMARTYALARIRFDLGEAAFGKAHDSLGLAAFLVSAVIFYFVSGRLAAAPRRVVVKRQGGTGAAKDG